MLSSTVMLGLHLIGGCKDMSYVIRVCDGTVFFVASILSESSTDYLLDSWTKNDNFYQNISSHSIPT